MIFKPLKQSRNSVWICILAFLCFYTNPFNINFDLQRTIASTILENYNHSELLNRLDNGKDKIILPYYPFKHQLTRKADSLFLQYADQSALEEYRNAYVYFQNIGNSEGIAYTGNMIAEVYINRLSEYELGKQQITKNKAFIKETFGEDHPLISDTYATYGSYHNKFAEAVEEQYYLDESLKICSNEYGIQSIQVAEINYRLGQFYQHSLGQLQDAKEYYNRALIIYREYLPSYHPDLIKVYFALGSTYRYLNDYHRALIHIDKAIYSYSLDSISNLKGYSRSLLVKANILNYMLQSDRAIIFYEAANELIKDVFGPDSFDAMLCYLGLSVNYLRAGDYRIAITYLDKTIAAYKNYFSVDKPIDLYPYLLFNKGECYSKLSNRDSTTYYLFKALEVQTTHFEENQEMIAISHRSIATVYKDFEQYDTALYHIQKGLIALKSDFNSMDIKQNPKIGSEEFMTELIGLLDLKAQVLLNKYFMDEKDTDLLIHALDLYKSLDQLSDNLKSSEYTQESKLILTNDIHPIYEMAITCTSKLYDKTGDPSYLADMLNFFEKNKYMLLFQNIELARKSNELNIPFEYQFMEDSLKLLLAELSRKVEDTDQSIANKISEDRYEVDNALQELRETIESKYPNYYKLEFDELVVELSQLKDFAAKSRSLLIEYLVGDSSIKVMAISQNRISVHDLKRTPEVNHKVQDFLSIISKLNHSENFQEDYNNFTNSAFNLYKFMILPILVDHDMESGSQMIISPDGFLAQIPFEALIQRLPESEYPNYTKLDYLIHSYDISYVYSFNLLINDSNKKLEKQNKLLAFSYSGIETETNPEKRSDGVFELPGTNLEIDAIRGIVKKDNLFLKDEEASETEFKMNSPNYQILHLAVHGISDIESSLNSRLVFKNQKDDLNDGNLFLYELYNIDLNRSKLAVLSACETGIGKEFKGEGVFSIARGFASAGCPSIIMSLWKVNDIVSAEIMVDFYTNLKKGKKINESLRNSKIEFITNSDPQKAHPGNWAAFVPLGQMNIIYKNNINPFLIGIIILAILIILFIIYNQRKLKKFNA